MPSRLHRIPHADHLDVALQKGRQNANGESAARKAEQINARLAAVFPRDFAFVIQPPFRLRDAFVQSKAQRRSGNRLMRPCADAFPVVATLLDIAFLHVRRCVVESYDIRIRRAFRLGAVLVRAVDENAEIPNHCSPPIQCPWEPKGQMSERSPTHTNNWFCSAPPPPYGACPPP